MKDTVPQVEIKVLVQPSPSAEAVLKRLGLDRSDATERTVAFFDTEKLELYEGKLAALEGVKTILRARVDVAAQEAETTVKLRTEGLLPEKLVAEAGKAKREFDYALGRSVMDSLALNSDEAATEVEAVFRGERKVKKAFGGKQKALLDMAVDDDFHWGDLVIFGPVRGVQVWKGRQVAGFEPAVTVEQWPLPAAGSRATRVVIEVSTRVAFSSAIETTRELEAALRALKLRLVDGGTKTQIVLEHFQR